MRSVRYPGVSDLEITTTRNPVSQQALLLEGVPLAFLPLIHHSLLVYSTPVADFVRENKFDLFAKSDYRFIESVFKLLVDAFSYKPAISVHQFFSEGFAEHKVILCKDIAALMKAKHKELSKTQTAGTKPTRVVQSSAADGAAILANKFKVVKHSTLQESSNQEE